MAVHCASSAKLALPTLLRSVFRSEATCDLSSPVRRWPCPLRPFQHSQHPRSFTSNSRILQSQSDDIISATPESHPSPSSESTPQLATTSDSTAPRQKNRSQGAKSRPANKPRNTKDQTETKKPRDRKDRKDRKESDKEKDKKRDKADKLPKKPKKPEIWEIQKDALGKKFPDGWNPAKRLSPDALDGIRHLNTTAPDRFTTAVLAEEFKVSPEAIRRILKSKWRPSEGEMDKRRVRWENRHEHGGVGFAPADPALAAFVGYQGAV
ncbi:unnamed protein product [Penicillium pancosmium]